MIKTPICDLLGIEHPIVLGGMGGGLLVSNIHHPDPFLDATIEDGDDVPAGEREDRVHAFSLECPGNDLPAVNASHTAKTTAPANSTGYSPCVPRKPAAKTASTSTIQSASP